MLYHIFEVGGIAICKTSQSFSNASRCRDFVKLSSLISVLECDEGPLVQPQYDVERNSGAGLCFCGVWLEPDFCYDHRRPVVDVLLRRSPYLV